MEKIKRLFATAASKNGSYSVGLTAMAVAAVLLFNLAAGQLPQQAKQIDISDNRLYEISEVSRDLLEGLEDPVEIRVLQKKESYDDRLVRFLESYAALSPNLSLEWIDPVLHPSVLTEYETQQNNVVVSCEATGKEKVIDYYDMIVPDYSSYYTTGSASKGQFDAEGQITGAVNTVTAGETHRIYYTSGHGESALSSQVNDLIEKISGETQELNLLMSTAVPEDCELLLISGPTADLAAEEIALLRDYMNRGGKVMILLGMSKEEQPNLEGFLAEYGMTVEQGYAADMERNLQGNYYWIFPEVTAGSPITDKMETEMLLMTNAKGITQTDPARDTISLNPVLQTSQEGYVVTEEGETRGQYLLGAVASETIAGSEEETEGEEEETKESRLTVLSSDTLIDGNLTAMYGSLENLTLFMNLVTENLSDVTNISIEPKNLAVTYNTMQHVGTISFAAVIGIPALFLLGGFLQWRRRRKA